MECFLRPMECLRWLWAKPEVCCPFGATFARILAEVKAAEGPSSEDVASLPEEVSGVAEEVEEARVPDEDISMTVLQDLPIALLIEIRDFVTVHQGYSALGQVSTIMMEVEASFNTEEEIPEKKVRCTGPAGLPRCLRLSARRGPTPILLNIYDVADTAQWLNSLFANYYAPVRFGGAFHTGLQVGSEEWAFGYTQHGTGVYRTMPRSLPHFRESVELTPTQLPEETIAQIYNLLVAQWPGREYHLLKRNCCHFASEASLLLGAGDLPDWTFRFANWGCAAAQAMGLIETPTVTSGI